MPSKNLPGAAGKVAEVYPDIWEAYASLGQACAESGPLDAKTRRLVKLALAIGAASEGATHSHARRGASDNLSAEEMKQVALLAIPTLGFPRAIAALTWIEDVTEKS